MYLPVRSRCRFGALVIFLIASLLLIQAPVQAQEDSPPLPPVQFQVVEVNGSSLGPSTEITAPPDSPFALIEAWERADEAAGMTDLRSEPYSIVGVDYSYRSASLYLPLITGGSGNATAAATQVWLGERGRPLTAEEVAFNLEISRQYEELAQRDLKALQQKVDAALVSTAGADGTDSILATTYVNKSIGGLNTIKEQNDGPHVNYCGPGAISVAIDAMWPLSSVPNMETIANTIRGYPQVANYRYPHFDASWGTTAYGLCRYVHDYWRSNFAYRYMFSPTSISATDNQDLWKKTAANVDRNYAILTGTNTSYLNGWQRQPYIAHIVSIIGYESYLIDGWYYDMRTMQYAETAGTAAGYDGGKFKELIAPTTFIAGVRSNNVQCALDPAVY